MRECCREKELVTDIEISERTVRLIRVLLVMLGLVGVK